MCAECGCELPLKDESADSRSNDENPAEETKAADTAVA